MKTTISKFIMLFAFTALIIAAIFTTAYKAASEQGSFTTRGPFQEISYQDDSAAENYR